jgi:hypothetical protein
MIRVLTEEEELHSRSTRYQQLQPGTLFDLSGKRFFLTVERQEEIVTVIALHADNITRILHDRPCRRARMRFAELRALNVH